MQAGRAEQIGDLVDGCFHQRPADDDDHGRDRQYTTGDQVAHYPVSAEDGSELPEVLGRAVARQLGQVAARTVEGVDGHEDPARRHVDDAEDDHRDHHGGQDADTLTQRGGLTGFDTRSAKHCHSLS